MATVRSPQLAALGGGTGGGLVSTLLLLAVEGDKSLPGSQFLPVMFGGALAALAAAWLAPQLRLTTALLLATGWEVILCGWVAVALARNGATGAGGVAVVTAVLGLGAAQLLVRSCNPGLHPRWRWIALGSTLVVAFGATGALRAGGAYVLDEVERKGIPSLDEALGNDILAGRSGVAWDRPIWDPRAPISQPHVRLTGRLGDPESTIDMSAGGFSPSAGGKSPLEGLDVRFEIDIRLPKPLHMTPIDASSPDPAYAVIAGDQPQYPPVGQAVRGTLKELLVSLGVRSELLGRLNGFTGTSHGIKCEVQGIPGAPGSAKAPAWVERIRIVGSGSYTAAP
jgi:hypothetical protein